MLVKMVNLFEQGHNSNPIAFLCGQYIRTSTIATIWAQIYKKKADLNC